MKWMVLHKSMINEQLKPNVKTRLTFGLLYLEIPLHNYLIIVVSLQLVYEKISKLI